MKLNLTKEWLTKRAELEKNAETSAGFFNLSVLDANHGKEHTTSVARVQGDNPLPVFGRLINLWRRKKGLRMDELSNKARIVHQLAKTLGLSSDRMLQLSGNMVVRDSTLGQEAIRFAAHSESVEKLNRNEQRALEEFVKFLNEK